MKKVLAVLLVAILSLAVAATDEAPPPVEEETSIGSDAAPVLPVPNANKEAHHKPNRPSENDSGKPPGPSHGAPAKGQNGRIPEGLRTSLPGKAPSGAWKGPSGRSSGSQGPDPKVHDGAWDGNPPEVKGLSAGKGPDGLKEGLPPRWTPDAGAIGHQNGKD